MAAERAAGGAVKETTTRVATGALGDLADRVEAYCDRNEGSDQLRHRTTVPVARIAWLGLRYFTEPIEDLQSDLNEDTGFDWLIDGDFTGEIDQEACWRRPFTFAEIAADYAVDRERPARDGGARENVTESLLDQLRDGGQRVVLGRPGSGKTTICKSVAHRWHEADDTGPVLYRKSGAGTFDNRPAPFDCAVERAKARGPVLVVVEDAARRETVGFLETVKEYAGDSDVSFLLDSRVSEWESGGEKFREVGEVSLQDAVGKDVRSLVGGEIEQRRVPPLDEREVERVVERFEAKTGKPVRESPEEILERIRSQEVGVEGLVGAEWDSVQAGEDGSLRPEPGPVQSGTGSSARPSPMLLLVYHLQRGDYAVDPEAMDTDGSRSALRTNVEEAYEAVAHPVASDYELMLRGREDLREQVAVLVTVLNASDIGVHRELVHALAESHSDHDTIDGFLANMEGILHFGIDEGTLYHAPHPLWSMLYLEVLRERKESESQARQVFAAAVNALFALMDDEERREEFREWYGRDVGLLSEIDENPTEVANEVVSSVFQIGKERPKLVTLYGTTEYSGLELPDSCSGETRVRCSLSRSQMYRLCGDSEQAVRELDVFREIGGELDVNSERIEGTYYGELGNIKLSKGEYDSAREHHERSFKIASEAGDVAGAAASLDSLGQVAQSQGFYDRAREFHTQSFKLSLQEGHLGSAASSLNNLGAVSGRLGDYGSALEYIDKALDIFREIGDLTGQAECLDNLGIIAKKQGDYEQASHFHEQSLEIKRTLGDRHGEAKSLGNLGIVFNNQRDYELARKFHKKSLNIFREINENMSKAISLDNLGIVARNQGNYQLAREYHKQSLDIFREWGDRPGKARNLNNLGTIALAKDSYERAQEHFEQAANIFREIGAIPYCLTTYDNLVQVAIEMDDPKSAIDYTKTALSIMEESDIPGLEEEHEEFESYLDQLETTDKE